MSELYELPNGWKWASLGTISNLIGGGTPQRNVAEYWDGGDIVWLSPTDLGPIGEISVVSESKDRITKLGLAESSAKLMPIGTVLYSSRATIGKIAINSIEVATNQGFCSFVCKDDLYNRYLAYCLSRFTADITDLSNSTTFKEVSKSNLKEFQIPLPPLTEQQRIVEKLDQLFEKIDKAIALHQKNIDEADAFMGSSLNEVFGELEEKYGLNPISTLFRIRSGDFLPKKNMVEDGDVDVYGGNGINGRHNASNLSGLNIVIGRVGALCGNVRCVKGEIWLTDNAFYISEYLEQIDKYFISQMLIHIDLGSSANKAAQRQCNFLSVNIPR